MHKRTWLRVIVFPAIIAGINALGISLFYVANWAGLMNFRLDGFLWIAIGYPLTVFVVLAIFSILKLRGEASR